MIAVAVAVVGLAVAAVLAATGGPLPALLAVIVTAFLTNAVAAVTHNPYP